MELDNRGVAAGVRYPDLDRTDAGAEVDVLVFRPVTGIGISDVEATVGVGAGFGLKAAGQRRGADLVVTGCLDLRGGGCHGSPARRPAGKLEAGVPFERRAGVRGQGILERCPVPHDLELLGGGRIVVDHQDARPVTGLGAIGAGSGGVAERVDKRRADQSGRVVGPHADRPGQHELTEMSQSVIVDVVSDRTGSRVDRNQPAAIAAAAEVRPAVLVERQAPLDERAAPVAHGVNDHFEVSAHLVTDPGSPGGLRDVLSKLGIKIAHGGHGAGRAFVPVPGDARHLRRTG